MHKKTRRFFNTAAQNECSFFTEELIYATSTSIQISLVQKSKSAALVFFFFYILFSYISIYPEFQVSNLFLHVCLDVNLCTVIYKKWQRL